MRNLKKRRSIYIILSVVALILNLLLIILRDDAAITRHSTVSIVFAVCSVAYAVMAFLYKEKGNLFVAGKFWFYRALSLTFSEKRSQAEKEKYKAEFELSAFLYCVTIPTYITLAFFATGFYSALSQALGWTVIRLLAIIIVVLVPPIFGGIKEKKQQRIKDETDRKEQERRESTGKWK